MAKKTVKMWVAKTLNGEDRTEEALTLKSLCGKIGISYNTAKKREGINSGVTTWLVGNTAWEVWGKEVDR
jgi:hypothetical protein